MLALCGLATAALFDSPNITRQNAAPHHTMPARTSPIETLESRIAPASVATFDLASLKGFNGFTIQGESANDLSGYSVSGAGDVNGDGLDDLLIGATGADPNGPRSGAAYVVFGKSQRFGPALELSRLNGKNGFKIQGEIDFDRLGISARGAGDLNGDGFDDLLIGAFTASPNGYNSGASYVIFGKAQRFAKRFELSSLDGENGFKLQGESAGDESGRSVAAAGDVNGDGIADLLVGAPNASAGSPNSGASYVIYGKTTGFTTPLNLSALNGSNGFQIRGEAAGDSSGYSVSGIGDVNGDGFDDVIIGAPFATSSGSGTAHVLFGKAAPFTTPFNLSMIDGTNGFKLQGEEGSRLLGISTSRAGDVNGDGFEDLIVGASSNDPNATEAGTAYVVFGKAAAFASPLDLSTLDGTNGFKLEGAAAGDAFGHAVSSAGDVNGDGFDDLLVGASMADPNGSSSGAAYLIFGKSGVFMTPLNSSNLTGLDGFALNGGMAGDLAGHSVSGAGDVNGDGFDDLLIGAIHAAPNGPESGASYVVFGHGARIASNGKTATFTDIDGDLVTVTVSKGKLARENFRFGADGTLVELDLRQGDVLPGSNLTVGAKSANGGNGRVNIGFIHAVSLDLGVVKVDGDLGQIDAGDPDFSTPGIRVLEVRSLGALVDTQPVTTPDALQSNLTGPLGALKVAASVKGLLHVGGSAESGIGLVTIGGSLDGSDGGGVLRSAGKIGRVIIHGSLIGGAGSSGIFCGATLGPVQIDHDLLGTDDAVPVVISALGNPMASSAAEAVAIASLNIKGEVHNALILAGYSTSLEALNADASIGAVQVGGSWSAASLVAGISDVTQDGFGRNDARIPGGDPSIVSRIASVTIKGTASGSAALNRFFGITAEQIGPTRIQGMLLVRDPGQPAVIDSNFTLVEL